MGKSTIREIVLETCDILWSCLHPIYVNQLNAQDFHHIKSDFERMWDLPNCIGALDGKHINIKRPPNSGSKFFNYKKKFSIVLLAACDARYCFTAIDVGAYGSQSDGGIFQNSEFGKKVLANQLGIPADSKLPRTNTKFPHFFVADPAFPLKVNIMRPYPGRRLDRDRRVFNYRLSRARVVIENAFGILAARWRVLQNDLQCYPENAEKVVLATVALHNFIILNNAAAEYIPQNYCDREDEDCNLHPGDWRQEVLGGFTRARFGSNNFGRRVFDLRDTLKHYFMNEGAIERQWKIV